MRINDNYIYFDAKEIVQAKLFLLDCSTNDIYVLSGETRDNYLACLQGATIDAQYLKLFKDRGLLQDD